MHTYDADRHEWRYDVGGYAWDNSELSTDLWLCYSYLRSVRADIFRMAEAMTRHTGESMSTISAGSRISAHDTEPSTTPTARSSCGSRTCATIGQLRNGFITGSALYDLDTGRFATDQVAVSVSHLSAVFGLVEICSELLDMIDDDGFTHAWVQYCRLYNATAAEQKAEVGQSFGNLNLGQAHSRLTAYAARRTDDAALAQRAWNEFYRGAAGYGRSTPSRSERIDGSAAPQPGRRGGVELHQRHRTVGARSDPEPCPGWRSAARKRRLTAAGIS